MPDPAPTPPPGAKPYYITTPIYYVNDRPHIGHCYTSVLADVAARFQRLTRGAPLAPRPPAPGPVFLLTGTDEHAEKVVTTAAERGLSTMAWADQNSEAFRRVFGELNIEFDDFIRTTQDRHKQAVARYLAKLMQTGDVAEGEYEGWYDVNDEAYITETRAKEQNYLANNGKPLVRRKERNFYFKLSRYQAWLEASIAGGELRIEPEARKNEVLGRLREGLQDVPITRPVTDDPATQFGIRMPGHEDHRVYVWIDALFNYLSAVDTPERRALWPADVHLMGKEILWFHAVIWPAILKALGEPLPRLIYAHSHYTRDGKKMSKSLGNFIDLETIRAYTTRYGVDALRWYLVTQGPLHATDADFSHAKFVEVYNADLANGIGNSTSRVSNMIAKYFDGKVPEWARSFVMLPGERGVHGQDWGELARAWLVDDGVLDAVDELKLDRACRKAAEVVTWVDNYISETRPFSLAKEISGPDDPKRRTLGIILYQCAEALRIASLLLAPAMPEKMADLWKRWNCTPPEGVPLAQLAEFGGQYALKPGTPIEKGDPLFMRADPAEPPPQ
jgi:methionyl-tRNA synthetase